MTAGRDKRDEVRKRTRKERKELREPRRQKYLLIALFSFPADKPFDESMCQCENVVRFQNQVTEKMEMLVQNNILFQSITHLHGDVTLKCLFYLIENQTTVA